VLEPMLAYLCPEEKGSSASNAASQFGSIASLLYGGRIFGRSGEDSIGTRTWLATGDEAAGTDPGVVAIATGINAILGSGGVGENASLSQANKERLTKEKEAAVKLFEEAEDGLAKLDAATATRDRVKGSLDSLRTHLDSIDKARGALGEASRVAVMSPADLRALCEQLTAALSPVGDAALPPFLQKVRERAGTAAASLPKPEIATATDTPGETKEKVIAPDDAAKLRFEQYDARFQNTAKLQFSQAGVEMIGRLQLEVEGIDKKVTEAKAAAGEPKYDGPRKGECVAACKAIDQCMGEIAVTSLLDAYAVLLKKYLDPILYFPLVRHTKTLSEAEFRAALESLVKLEKDRAYFADTMPPAYRNSTGAKTMSDIFAALGEVVSISKAVNPAAKSQEGGDGIIVQRGYVKPAEKKPDPNAPQPVQPFNDPRFPPQPPVPVQPAPEVEVGVLSAIVSQNGFGLLGGTGQSQKAKIHPGQQLTFTVEHRPAGALQPRREAAVIPRTATEPWGVVRWMSERENRNFVLPESKVTFGLDSSPPLPGPKAWPQRSTFGLP
jgi:hypothetical protein